MPVDTTLYAESYSDAHGARCDDGSMRAIAELVAAGSLGDPDTYVSGRVLGLGDYLVATVDDIAEPIEIIDY